MKMQANLQGEIGSDISTIDHLTNAANGYGHHGESRKKAGGAL